MQGFKNHFISVFLVAVMAVGAGAIFIRSAPSIGDVGFEKKIDEDFILKDISVNFWKYLSFKVFGEGVKGVLIGNDGWLFTDEEFSQPEGYLENIKNNQDYILSVQKELSDIRLLIVPIPAKSRVYEDKLGRYKIPDYRRNIYAEFIEFLNENNIGNVNLLSVYEGHKDQELYYKTDTHWTPAGAALTAQNILKPISNIKFKIKEKEVVYFTGDLVKYTSENGFLQERYTDYDIIGGNNDDLFGDQYFPVVLIGTSYSADKRWNFEGALKAYLRADILNLADEGLGPFQVMDNYLKGTYLSAQKPKLIIWEIPERYLPVANGVS